ncbi:hypothetical protein [Sphingomonas crocodyli]|uniref:Terminase n=1 Tax=Sphingomonas crocodyli TaxID=1979270 RepID=A0A437M6X0_9SPHN|nr:hypothetical protein [Sphingomonas crocodyli]RVT93399.1 hypothetical protein EOD43_05845 [Sphingomonas crocodyli]
MAAESKRAKFLDVLGHSLNVSEACRESGLSSTTVYRLRRKDAAFRDGWMAALGEAYARLETELLGRALFGVERAVIHGGEIKCYVREYSDRLGLAMLAAYRARMKDGGSIETEDEMRAAITDEVKAIAKRLKGDDDDAVFA